MHSRNGYSTLNQWLLWATNGNQGKKGDGHLKF